SKENIKNNISQVKERSRYIISNLKEAKELEAKVSKSKSISEVIIEDLQIGEGGVAKCDDFVSINYRVYVSSYEASFDQEVKLLDKVENYQFIIGSPEIDEVIGSKVIGMREGGVRMVTLPSNYKTDDKKIEQYLDGS